MVPNKKLASISHNTGVLIELIATILLALVFTMVELAVHRWTSAEYARKEDLEDLEIRILEIENALEEES